MKILITNDDGIDAIGIKLLAQWAKKLGEVTVIAPKLEQSGKSHAINFVGKIEIKKVDLMDGVTAYSMDSTPADCVRYGVLGLKENYDIVLSGMNCGINVGADMVYSGTVGAVFEAGRLGICGIALSTFPDNLEDAGKYFDEVYNYIIDNSLFCETPIYNVNIPYSPAEIRMTYQGSQYYTDEFYHLDGDIYYQDGHPIPDVCPDDLDRDTVAVLNSIISVTPLMTSRTDMRVFEKYKLDVRN